VETNILHIINIKRNLIYHLIFYISSYFDMLLPTTSKNYKKLDQIFIFLIIIVSLGLFWLNYTNRISINQLLFGEITLFLALVALLLPPGSDIKSLSLPIRFPLWVLPATVYLVSEVEILLFRHTDLCYLLTPALALILIVLADEKPAKKVAVTMSIIGVFRSIRSTSLRLATIRGETLSGLFKH